MPAVVCSRAMDMPLDRISDPYTEPGFRALARRGLLAEPSQAIFDAREVLEVFEVPLAFLMDDANHTKHRRPWRGRERSYYAMPYEGRYIWGATAGMLKNLQQRLFQR